MSKHRADFLADGVYVVKDGITKPVQAPATGFGKTIISWESNKPTRLTHECSEKL